MSVVGVTNPHYVYSLARAIRACEHAHYVSMDATLSRVEDCFTRVRYWRELQDGLLDKNAQLRLKERYFWWASHGTAALVTAATALATLHPLLTFQAGYTTWELAQKANMAYQNSLFSKTSAEQTDLTGSIASSLDEAREAEAKSGFSARLFDQIMKTFSRSVAAAT